MAKTDIIFILDKSGSMHGLEDDTIGGFNAFIDKQKALSDEARVTTILFDTRVTVLYDRSDLKAIKPLTRNEYFTGSSTALLDAVGNAVQDFKHRQESGDGNFDAEKVIFIITTDGYENSSHEYSYSSVKALIEEQKSKGWEFIFLGANIDALGTADMMGVSRSRSKNYHNDSQGVSVNFDTVSDAVESYRSSSRDTALDENWGRRIDHDYSSRKGKK
jgi:uncharacterized protein YegL